MKRTLSLEAQAAVARLSALGFTPAGALPSNGGPHPLAVLGLGSDAGWKEVKHAFHLRLRQFPPERCPTEFVQIVDAYDAIKKHVRNVEIQEEAVLTGKRRRVTQATDMGGTMAPFGVAIALDMSSGVAHSTDATAAAPPAPRAVTAGGYAVMAAPTPCITSAATAAAAANAGALGFDEEDDGPLTRSKAVGAPSAHGGECVGFGGNGMCIG